MWPFKKISVDQALQGLVDGLSAAWGPKLVSITLFGSKVSGEYREDRSDVNVFILAQDLSLETLGQAAKPVQTWLRAGYRMPVLVTKSDLAIYANNLPIEFLDMQDHHQVVFGPDPLQSLSVDPVHLHAQCAQELSLKQLKLRQAILAAGGGEKRLREVLLGSLSSVLTLYRAVLRLEAEVPKGDKMIAAKELAKRVGFDGDCLERIQDLHLRRQTDKMDELARQYLQCLGRVLVYVSRR